MRPLTPNGDIVKRQFVDPLTVSSREGIYEVARGIALRMAWNKPDAYEKAKDGDWSFVEWEKTPFYTQYKIPWTKDDEESPLMFGAVRTLIDEWNRRLLSRSERYIGWKRYFSLVCSYYDLFGTFTIDSNHLVDAWEFTTCARSVIGAKGGTTDPFLTERKNDLKIDCGYGAILACAKMIEAVEGTATPLEYSLTDYARPFFGGYNASIGDASYKRFKKNPLTLDDEWEMGMAALVGMFDRCYWAMMDAFGGLAHPPVVVTNEKKTHTARFSLTWSISEYPSGYYIDCKPSFDGVSVESVDETVAVGETEIISLERSVRLQAGYVRAKFRYDFGPAETFITLPGDTYVALNIYINGRFYPEVRYKIRSSMPVMEEAPSISDHVFIGGRVKDVSVNKSFSQVEDHVSQSTWIFERYDSELDGGYHHGEMLPEVRDKKLMEAYSEYVASLHEHHDIGMQFNEFSVSFVRGSDEIRFVAAERSIHDIYDTGGHYVGSVTGISSFEEWHHYYPAYNPEAYTEYDESSVPVPGYWNGEWNMDYDAVFELKNAVIGRSDIPL